MPPIFNPDLTRPGAIPAPTITGTATPPPGVTGGRKDRGYGFGGPNGVRGKFFDVANPNNTSPWANPVIDPNAPPKFNLLSQTKNQGLADANTAALNRATSTGNEIGSDLKRYLAQSQKLNAQAGDQLAKDAATYDVSGLRGDLAAQDARYEAAARAQANRAVDFASRASDRTEMNRGALGMSSQRDSERSRAYLDAVLPVEQQLAERQARTSMALKQMELANAGRARADIQNYQSQLFNPISQRLGVAQGVDSLLNPITARDQANTFYGLQTQYQPNVPAPTYYGPQVTVPEVRGGGMPAQGQVAQPVRQVNAPPAPSGPFAYQPRSVAGGSIGAPGVNGGRTFYFANGQPAPSAQQQNINLQRAIAGEQVDSGPSGYYTNGAPMPGRYAAAAQMASLVPYSAAYQRPYQPLVPTVPQVRYGAPRFQPPPDAPQPRVRPNAVDNDPYRAAFEQYYNETNPRPMVQGAPYPAPEYGGRQMVTVYSPQGTPLNVSTENLFNALDAGYTLPPGA